MLTHSLWGVAHPTGNMITVEDNVLWSYISPVDDPSHKACVMIWKKGAKPQVFIKSEFPASDYMLYNNRDQIYVIERRHLETSQTFEVRVLKAKLGTKPKVIWDWFKDEWRIGEGGFFMRSDDQIIFGKYPGIYRLEKGGEPLIYFKFDQAINRIRAVENNNILILTENDCYLTEQNGAILEHWPKLIEDEGNDAPLNRNQIFDADFHNGKLLLAYWGKRSFELVDKTKRKKNIYQQAAPLTPHWVAFWGDEKLLFSSRLIFDGSPPTPYLVLLKGDKDKQLIWDAN